MDSTAETAVRRAVDFMYENFNEPITADWIARSAMYSKFYFSRVFRTITGVSPGRFLSAIRVQEAKRLLIYTEQSVLHISIQVGYNSVGTFSSRFSSIVGYSPTMYRKLNGYASEVVPTMPPVTWRGDLRDAAVRGVVPGGALPQPFRPVFLGLFTERVPQGLPVTCAMLNRPGPFVFRDVPPGDWYLLAYSRPVGRAINEAGAQGAVEGCYICFYGPIRVGGTSIALPITVDMRPMTALDPPILLALPDHTDRYDVEDAVALGSSLRTATRLNS